VAPRKKQQLFDLFLDDRPVLYKNPEYMEFFNRFFDRHITGNNKFIKRKDLMITINELNSYPALLDSLGKDTLLRNEAIRELALFIALKELYHDPAFPDRNIISILEQMINQSNISEHHSIASTLITELTRLNEGTPAPYFKLPSIQGDSVSPDDLKGKPVYLSFKTTWSSPCLAEFALMDTLYGQYGTEIQFVSVMFDLDPDVVKRFRQEKGYQWIFLFNGTGTDLIEKYNIRTFPVFMLIDKEGIIYRYPAYKPSEVIETDFINLLKGNK
jgi:thiol-disulfide isomerase/thioredoxin